MRTIKRKPQGVFGRVRRWMCAQRPDILRRILRDLASALLMLEGTMKLYYDPITVNCRKVVAGFSLMRSASRNRM